MSSIRTIVTRVVMGLACLVLVLLAPERALASCLLPANAIEAENCLPGTPAGIWDTGGDHSIEGFTTDISANVGGTVVFKVLSDASDWQLEIYRMGYYGGDGARLVDTVAPSVALPQSQPACLSDPSTGLVDCGNWSPSATWQVPTTAVSGIYFARAVRSDTGGSSHIVFVVRDDSSQSDILFQTSDTTWQAYNQYGGNSLYHGSPAGRALEVSYNRPFRTREVEAETWVFNAEYPMVRWLEANGYDVTYHAGIDADRFGSLIQNHSVWMSNGHDEYWSAAQRAHVEAARDAGVHLAFFSSNKIYWRIRWEAGLDGSGTPYRKMVCYKDTLAGQLLDPSGDATGTWRDGRFNADGGRPENELGGSIFMINGYYQDTLTVPHEDGQMRFWRDTGIAALAPGQVATLAEGTIGTEVDVDLDNGFRPAGMFGLSTNQITTGHLYLLDEGGTFGAGTATHRLTLYRHASGALVFAAGTYQWAWGLDANHDRAEVGPETDLDMQQATVNLLADMGVQPASLDAALLPAVASNDITPPSSSITWPLPGTEHAPGERIVFSGTATDIGGNVGGVEISVDGGLTWRSASGRSTWSYEWQPTGSGLLSVQTRAVDDTGNLEAPGPGTTITITELPACISCSLFPSASVPSVDDGGADDPVELGVTFRSEVDGTVRGVRFYRSAANTGTHLGHLWTIDGSLLGTVTFSGASGTGWQQADFATPIAIQAETLYVASYHATTGHYAADTYWSGRAAPPLHAPGDGAVIDGVVVRNGRFAYGPAGTFPTNTWNAANYYVDVAFEPSQTTLTSIAVTPAEPELRLGNALQFTAIASYSDGSTIDVTDYVVWSSSSASVATINATGNVQATGLGATTIAATRQGIVGSTTVTVAVGPLLVETTSLPSAFRSEAYAARLEARGGLPPHTWSATGLPSGIVVSADGFLSGSTTASGLYAVTVEAADASGLIATAAFELVVAEAFYHSLLAERQPSVSGTGPDSAVEVGMTFHASGDGEITGVRFFKDAANVGPHTAHLWSIEGALLATAEFTNETASGWQEVSFATAVPIEANNLYVASYHTAVGHYAGEEGWQGASHGPLHAPRDGTVFAGQMVSNGVFGYGPPGTFPTASWNASNYWVDVVFRQRAAPLQSITVTPANQVIPLGSSQAFTAIGHFSNGSTRDIGSSVTWSASPTATLSIDPGGVATAVGTGTAVVSADLEGIIGSTAATVEIVEIAEPSDYTLMQPGHVPAVADGGADAPVELGVAFHSDVPGTVQGVRFYKSAANTGTHTGHLWTIDGTLLASVTFQDETPSGWQEALFAQPVAIQSGRLYVASYHTASGHYAVESSWPGWDAPPLHAPANGTGFDGSFVTNGRFAYGPSGSFPETSWNATSYGVDVSFRPAANLPTVLSIEVTPAGHEIQVGARYQLVATATLSDGSTQSVRASWASSAPAVATVDGAGMGTALAGGSALISATFGDVTGSAALHVSDPPPAPTSGPGGPILVIADDSQPFSYYLAEILRAEGLNAFDVQPLDQITPELLLQYDVAILGNMPLTAAHAVMLEAWVNAGGNLVAMRPDQKLAGLLGLISIGTTLEEAYLLIETTSEAGSGLVGETIQFHGAADLYVLAGATRLARLYSNASTPTVSPAVTMRRVGAGTAAAFTFDLARSIVYTRQGNPAWSGQHRDGYTQIRSNNLFFGHASGDLRPDWVDFSRITIPQADEQQRLLANLIILMNLERKPLPRFWYLPSSHKAVVVMTGDDHANAGTRQRFLDYVAYSSPGCSVDDWECVRGTSYIYDNTPLSTADALYFNSLGFETALHVDTGCADWDSRAHLQQIYSAGLASFAARYVGLPPPLTNRTHCIIWSDYDSQPAVSLASGIRLDTNYYYWPAEWVRDRPGFMTGSGMPMRFADRYGSLIDVYQAATHLTDESGQTYPHSVDVLLDLATGPSGYYGVFTANIHTDFNPIPASDSIVISALTRGIPVVTARQMLTWLDGRNGSFFADLNWSSNVLSFDVSLADGARNIRAMVPYSAGASEVISVRLNGVAISFVQERIKGVDYVLFDAEAGSYDITYL